MSAKPEGLKFNLWRDEEKYLCYMEMVICCVVWFKIMHKLYIPGPGCLEFSERYKIQYKQQQWAGIKIPWCLLLTWRWSFLK